MRTTRSSPNHRPASHGRTRLLRCSSDVEPGFTSTMAPARKPFGSSPIRTELRPAGRVFPAGGDDANAAALILETEALPPAVLALLLAGQLDDPARAEALAEDEQRSELPIHVDRRGARIRLGAVDRGGIGGGDRKFG